MFAMCASPLAGQTFALATLHDKARAIAPALAHLGVSLRVAAIDTDQLGTFSGEIERPGSMREAAIEKARRGALALGLRYGLASEGSFGPDPTLPFLASGTELLVFLDTQTGHVVAEQVRTQTNFAHVSLTPGADIDAFLSRIGFPDHAVIVRPDLPDRATPNAKGLTSRAALEDARLKLAPFGPLRLETDMRAHLNPSRMGEIARLAEKLTERLATACPACAAPGFGRIDVRLGLPCADCGTPANLVASEIFGCTACGVTQERPRSDGRTQADPAHCPSCNP
jgi:hypothetical protein